MKELHRETDPSQVSAFQAQVTRSRRTAAEHNRIELFHQLIGRQVSPHVCARDEAYALRRHKINAALHHRFFELHVRNAVHQEAADAVGPLEYGYPMTSAIELSCAGEAGGARTNHGNLLSC